jgi:hypothetical protein
MGTALVQSILDRAIVILQDTTNVRWPAVELVDWVTDGEREAVMFKPSAYSKNESMLLTAGTKQTIPATGIQLLDVVRNTGPNGTSPGRAIRLIEREILDANTPDWHYMAATAVVKHFTYASNDPKTFYVYPPSTGSSYAELVYSAAPPVATLGGTLSIDDIYQGAILDYVLYRAYQKDAEYAADPARAASHYQAFVTALAGRNKSEKTENPNVDQHSNPNSSRR